MCAVKAPSPTSRAPLHDRRLRFCLSTFLFLMNKSELSVRRTPIRPASGVCFFWKWHETQTAGRPCPRGLMPQGTWQPAGTPGRQEAEEQQPVLPLPSPCVSSSESHRRVVVKCSQLFKCQRNPRHLQKWNSVEYLLRNGAKFCPEKPELSHPMEPGGSMV